MNLPPPPPPGKRHFQMLTKKGQAAVEKRSEPLYKMLVDSIWQMNPGCFADRDEIRTLLERYIWPPKNLETLFQDFPHIPKIATHLRPGRFWIEVFVADPVRYFQTAAERVSIKASFVDTYGTIHEFRKRKSEFIAEGHTAAEFDGIFIETIAKAERAVRPPWWKFWKK